MSTGQNVRIIGMKQTVQHAVGHLRETWFHITADLLVLTVQERRIAQFSN